LELTVDKLVSTTLFLKSNLHCQTFCVCFSPIHSFTHSVIHQIIILFMNSFFILQLIHSLIHPSIHSPTHSFIRSFIHSFIHSLTHSPLRYQGTLTTMVPVTSHSVLNMWSIFINHTSSESLFATQSKYVRILLYFRKKQGATRQLWYSNTFFQKVKVQHVLAQSDCKKCFYVVKRLNLKTMSLIFYLCLRCKNIRWYVEKMPKNTIFNFYVEYLSNKNLNQKFKLLSS